MPKRTKFISATRRRLQDIDTLKLLYYSFVRSKLEYCFSLWSPYKKSSRRIEREPHPSLRRLPRPFSSSTPLARITQKLNSFHQDLSSFPSFNKKVDE